MITIENLPKVLENLKYVKSKRKDEYIKEYTEFDCKIKVDFKNKKIIYPQDKGMIIHRETTCNFSENENFVVLECITSLLDKGYKPEHIELEKPMPGGHNDTGGFCDIQVKDNDGKTFLLIECKKADEFDKYWKKTLIDGDQLFRYFNSYRQAQALCMYMSDYSDEGKIQRYTNIISMLDNEEYLQTNKNLKSFRQVRLDNGDKEDYFKVWRDTYQQDYATRGIFEEDIDAYTVGKLKYTVKDLVEVDNNSIQKKYHEFATILRQHNVGSHENAFDKLINLFLAKIVDETINPTELQCYWKGAAYDDYFSLQDRLQKLYKEGMEKFLGEKVTYIDQKEINDAFHLFKNDPDATKNKILDYFRQLKFYTNSDFAFIDVHNEELFYQNADILKRIIMMFEDIKLKTEQHNQFLGDLFEGFLDDGVKQSEGQYFTPLPIVKYIVNSLPIENLILNSKELPKVIDYACGAGHFLTEYASYIKPIVEKKGEFSLSNYYANIYGIEKEYRLSKVAKVSAFMYGYDEIKIVYADALSKKEIIEDGKYSVLIANPPYSVKGFLEVLGDEKDKYTLTSYVSDISKNNSIETFFVERAKQLLKSDGIAAIVLPITILTTKDNLYTACREILLKYFDIVAISEFASGTFGKTPTNTVVLFMKRKDSNPDLAEHFYNRVTSWYTFDNSKDIVFEDTYMIEEYCKHCGINYDEYIHWLQGGELPKADIFQKYIESTRSNAAFKNILKKKISSKYTETDKEEEINLYIQEFIKKIEMEKLYFYMLTASNKFPVIVSKTPTGKDLKQFLGYDWSGEKGKEGIKYIGNIADDGNAISKNEGINSILTPLFDPQNSNANDKICTIIRNNFEQKEIYVPEHLREYVNIYNLEDMIDFSRVEFNKAIKTSVAKKLVVKSKYKTEKISKVCEKINPSRTEISAIDKDIIISFVDMESVSTQGIITKFENRKLSEVSGSYTYFKDGDIIIAKITPCMENGKCALATKLKNGIGMGSSEFHVFRAGKKVLNTYLFIYLNREIIRKYAQMNMTGASGHRRVPIEFYEDLLIPVPPKSIQKEIVDKCDKLDKEYYAALNENLEIDKKISALIASQSGTTSTLGALASYATKRKMYAEIEKKSYVSTDTMLQNCEGRIEYETVFNIEKVVEYFEGDILVSNIRPYLKKIWLADRAGGCSPDVLVFRVANRKEILPKYLYYVMKQQEFFDWMMSDAVGMKMPRGNKDTILSFSVKVPDMTTQKQVISLIDKFEKQQYKNKCIINEYSQNKEDIVKEYLDLK